MNNINNKKSNCCAPKINNQKKRNGIFKNTVIVWKDAITNYNPKIILTSIIFIVTTVAITFFTMALPSFVVNMLTQNYRVLNIVIYIALYATILMLLNLILQNISYSNMEYEFIQRINNGMKIDYKIITTDYQNIDTSDGNDKLTKSTRAVYYNDDKGFPGIIVNSRNMLINIINLIVYSIIASTLNPFLLMVIIVTPIINIIANARRIKWIENHKDEWAKYDSKFRYLKNESLRQKNGKDIRLYKIQNWFTDLFYNVVNLRMEWQNKELRIQFLTEFIGRLVTLIQNILIYGYLFIMVKNGMHIDMFILYLGVVSGIGGFIKMIFDDYTKISINNVYINDYYDFINMKEESNRGDSISNLDDETCNIKLENVCYKYPGTEKNIFTKLNLHIKKGEKIAIVGENGAGKSTLIKIICGLYQPNSGSVLINNKYKNDFNIFDYYDQFSVAFQDVDVFAFTIAQNIACTTSSNIDRNRVYKCIELAGLKDKVDELKNGIDTHLTKELEDDGVLLSGGETQKLMLARALYKNGRIIILDEPTAALDPIAEGEMYQKYSSLTSDKTSIFISHRLSSTKFCDRILFMKNGEIIESGTHDELISLGGAYAKMFEIQSHYYQKNIVETNGGVCDEEIF